VGGTSLDYLKLVSVGLCIAVACVPSPGPDGGVNPGEITTVAGIGEPGYTGDGGSASQARLLNPLDVVIMMNGDMVIVDHGNHCLRFVSAETDAISTMAGTGLSSGEGALNLPTAVAFDLGDGFYVASWGEHRIYYYPPDGGPRQLVAGIGETGCTENYGGMLATQSHISFPRSVGLLDDGSLLFAEQGCHRIRHVVDDGELATFAGTGEAGFAGDFGPSVNAQFAALNGDPIDPTFGFGLSPETPPDELYVADTANHVIREINLRNGEVTTFAGIPGEPGFIDGPPAQARFNSPTAVITSQDHAVWVVDRGNHAVRRIDPLAIEVTTVVGTGEPGFNGDGIDASLAQLNNPSGIFVTRDNTTLFIADTDNQRIRKVDLR